MPRKKKPERTRGLSVSEIEFLESIAEYDFSGDFATTVKNWTDLENSPINELQSQLEFLRDSLGSIEESIEELSRSYESEGYPAPEAPDDDDEEGDDDE